MSLSYRQVHRKVRRERGRAADQVCVTCGAPGQHWAYQYNGGSSELTDAAGRRYTEDVSCYSPMCGSCHRRFDLAQEERLATVARDNGARTGAENAARMKSDPEYAVRRKATSTATAHALAARAKTDVSYAEVMDAAREKAKASLRLKYAEDEEYRARVAAAARRTSQLRRSCAECGKVSNPGNLGRHQKATGHEGWSST